MKCPVCKSNLVEEMKNELYDFGTFPKGTKVFPCDVCQKAFRKVNSMLIEIKIPENSIK